ncbi:MAG: acylphosphatase [Dehalococcoidia bacterium]|nr:acylphosphatase [Dehalococcoidia bacterium]
MSERPESPMSTVALHAIVRGRVQGVNFRHFVYGRAISLGLAGYVRNLPDMRSVEVVAESQRERLELLLAQLREGPRGARVDSVEVQWGKASGQYSQFRVTL